MTPWWVIVQIIKATKQYDTNDNDNDNDDDDDDDDDDDKIIYGII